MHKTKKIFLCTPIYISCIDRNIGIFSEICYKFLELTKDSVMVNAGKNIIHFEIKGIKFLFAIIQNNTVHILTLPSVSLNNFKVSKIFTYDVNTNYDELLKKIKRDVFILTNNIDDNSIANMPKYTIFGEEIKEIKNASKLIRAINNNDYMGINRPKDEYSTNYANTMIFM